MEKKHLTYRYPKEATGEEHVIITQIWNYQSGKWWEIEEKKETWLLKRDPIIIA